MMSPTRSTHVSLTSLTDAGWVALRAVVLIHVVLWSEFSASLVEPIVDVSRSMWCGRDCGGHSFWYPRDAFNIIQEDSSDVPVPLLPLQIEVSQLLRGAAFFFVMEKIVVALVPQFVDKFAVMVPLVPQMFFNNAL